MANPANGTGVYAARARAAGRAGSLNA